MDLTPSARKPVNVFSIAERDEYISVLCRGRYSLHIICARSQFTQGPERGTCLSHIIKHVNIACPAADCREPTSTFVFSGYVVLYLMGMMSGYIIQHVRLW